MWGLSSGCSRRVVQSPEEIRGDAIAILCHKGTGKGTVGTGIVQQEDGG